VYFNYVILRSDCGKLFYAFRLAAENDERLCAGNVGVRGTSAADRRWAHRPSEVRHGRDKVTDVLRNSADVNSVHHDTKFLNDALFNHANQC